VRERDFVPQGTNEAYPDLDEDGMLPVIDLDGEDVDEAWKANASKAKEMVKTIITDAFAKGPSPEQRIVQREHEPWNHWFTFSKVESAAREALAIPAEEAAESWLISNPEGDLAETLEGIGRDLTAYAAAVRAAEPERLRLVKVADPDDGGPS
jgi:hypothetical protein